MLEWKHDPMSLMRWVADTHLHAIGGAGVTLRLAETSNSFPSHAGCLPCWADSRGGVLLLQRSFQMSEHKLVIFRVYDFIRDRVSGAGMQLSLEVLPLLVDRAGLAVFEMWAC